MEQPTELQWDGKHLPYDPPSQLKIDPRLALHTEVADTLDPITHEVIRFTLWSINVEHGNVTMRVSGSPSAAYGHDFNPTILDEVGDYCFFGPFIQYHAITTGAAIKWTLENRSTSPGIGPGDMYLTTDPFIAPPHQPDVTILGPVFIDGSLFCWVGNAMHTWDLGGTTPSGMNPMAPDIFWEAAAIPPVKIIDAGELRIDVADFFTAHSRLPDLVALDLRATTAGVKLAVDRIQTLVARYGASTVKASMRKLQDDSEKAFVRRIATAPDGTWTEEYWAESRLPGDRGIYPLRLTLTKKDERLIFTNAGSAEQGGSGNVTLPALKGGIVSRLMTALLYDQMFVTEGALRHCDFVMEPGKINCATRPAAVSGGPPMVLMPMMGIAGMLVSRMLACSTDPEVRAEVQTCMGHMVHPGAMFFGASADGTPFMSFFLDANSSALSASPIADGQDTGGFAWDLQSTVPNVEEYESHYPILYLWRRELPDSGGAGRFRGGNSGETAVVVHGSDGMFLDTVAGGLSMGSSGFFGGYPSSPNSFRLARGSSVQKLLADGRVPRSYEELGGETGYLGAKSVNNWLTPDDVWVLSWSSAAGYGDPLQRDIALVENDVEHGKVTGEWAERTYGVVVGDPEASARTRERLEAERLGDVQLDVAAPDAPKRARNANVVQAEGLEWDPDGNVACVRCGRELARGGSDWKAGAILKYRPLPELNPYYTAPDHTYIDEEVEACLVLCPGCGALLNIELSVDRATPPWDTRIGRTDLNEARTR